jgi:hypothetical protein
MSEAMSGVDLKEFMKPTMTALARCQGADPLETWDNSGVWVAMHMDWDYEQWYLLEVRKPYKNPDGPTMVDFLYVHWGAYDTWEVEWRNKPRNLFAQEDYILQAQHDFLLWVEGMMELEQDMETARELKMGRITKPMNKQD